MFRDRVVSMEQTLEGGEKHLALLKDMCREALPELEFREHSLDHERDLFVMDLAGADGIARRICWTRMVLFDAERIPAMTGEAGAALREKIVQFLRARAAQPEIVVTFRHLEEGWVDTPEPRREGGRRRRRGGRGRGRDQGQERGGERRGQQQPQGERRPGPGGPQPQRDRRPGGAPPERRPGAQPGQPQRPQGQPRGPQPPRPAPVSVVADGAASGEPGGGGKRRRRFRRRRRGRGGAGGGSGSGPAPGGAPGAAP
jgi:hypothetical protein